MVYQYTIPRKPIGAMQCSPGPIYALPSIFDKSKSHHNSNYLNAPSWKMGTIMKENRFVTNSPGPCYSVNGKMLRTGLCKSEKFSIHGRLNSQSTLVTPGPDLYFSEKSTNKVSHQKSAPAYSISSGFSSHPERNKNPAPNSYVIKPAIGKIFESGKASAPAYSIISRKKMGSFNEDLRNTPGPNSYALPPGDTYKNKLPTYSLYGRTQMPSDSVLKPGPGAYSSEKVLLSQKSSPSLSFGIKHSPYAGEFILPCDVA